MQINKTQNGSNLTIALIGRLDTVTAPQLDACLAESLDGITDLCFDFSDLEYTSSAGLRSLLSAQKKMNAKGGSMKVQKPNDSIAEIFEVTGFSDILTIE